jgi:3-oxoacyl-[acyl-carrier protein] reductase
MNLKDKVAVITGSSSGVGAALATKLASEGAIVVINYNQSEEGAIRTRDNIVATGGQAVILQGDVSEEADCERIAEKAIGSFGRLDILVNNAGCTTFVPHENLKDLTSAIWERTLRVNLMGAFFMSRAAMPHLQKAGGGEIVMTSSIASQTASGSSIAYCASKAGMNSLTRSLAKAFGKDNIRVNAVLPGLIDGDWAFDTWGDGDDARYEALKTQFSEMTPLGHVVEPADVADVILSIITGSDYVTGQLVTIDGGFTL